MTVVLNPAAQGKHEIEEVGVHDGGIDDHRAAGTYAAGGTGGFARYRAIVGLDEGYDLVHETAHEHR